MVDKSISTHAGAISHHSNLLSGYTLRIPRDGEQSFHGIVNMDSTAT
jgi:hypothetical protein